MRSMWMRRFGAEPDPRVASPGIYSMHQRGQPSHRWAWG
ncbi:hypothetical protein FOTG_03060 [Fusarium oxysporum f. sp. vasinfectum 25433]|uniref:Uncharacterized protein n=1 Tax=Fusarium oxysporum f. sp. vasinfectum 25433 TaxID=1089449 RepID=X0MH74_FUSOX|nr:hypothetical protein FOTG_03060 [Fusarium oxysporum f. sp. vasinfectum 25433]